MISRLAHSRYGRLAMRAFAHALVVIVAACGGGGGSDAQSPMAPPPPPPPAAGSVTIPSGSEIVALGVGDAEQTVYAMQGERSAERLELISREPAAQYDVTVAEGGAFMSAVQANDGWSLAIDAKELAADTAYGYRVQVRNRKTGQTAEVVGATKVLKPEVGSTAQITSAGGSLPIGGGLGQVVFEPISGAQTLSATVLTAHTPGGTLVRVKLNADISEDIRGVRFELDPTIATTSDLRSTPTTAAQRMTISGLSNGFEEIKGSGRTGLFTQFHGFRLSSGTIPLGLVARVSCSVLSPSARLLSDLCFRAAPAWKLSRKGKTIDDGAEPVLFVHGYNLSVPLLGSPLGGGDGTWGEFAKHIEEQTRPAAGGRLQSYEFQWATNAKFEQVADDLARAIDKIHADTNGKRVTIIAHSFGGTLVRTMLQGLGKVGQSLGIDTKVKQVITLGTPHSGVAQSVDFEAGEARVRLPLGRDSELIAACKQITCHQMGGGWLLDFQAALVGVPTRGGSLAASLSDFDAHPLPPGIPFAVGIGLGLELSSAGQVLVSSGDGLISYDGQRFKPDLRFRSGYADDYLNCQLSKWGTVREEVIGAATRLPLQTADSSEKGLIHTWIQA